MNIFHLTAQEASDLLAGDIKIEIIDVRTAEEFDMFRIEGALNFDLSLDGFGTTICCLDKSAPYLLHCHSGDRSKQALEVLKRQDFERIYHLDGGLREWAYQGFPHIYNHTL